MPINETVINVNFQPVNQQAPDTTAPIGRLARMRNAVTEQFEGTAIKVKQRTGFRQITKKVINPVDVVIETEDGGFADTPELMASLETQLVVCADSSPYVLAESANEWSHYPHVLHVNSPRQRPIYTSNVKIKCQDSACIDNVVCYVWKQTHGTLATTWVMVRDLDGTVIVSPRTLGQADSEEGQYCQIKVIQDGLRFWIFQSYDVDCILNVVLPDGTFSGFSSFATLDTFDGPNWWDCQYNERGVVWFAKTSTVNAAMYSFAWAAGAVTPTLHDYSSDITYSPFRPFWLTDPNNPNVVYLGIATNLDGATQINVETFNAATGAHLSSINMQSGFIWADMCELSGFVDKDITINVLRSDLATSPVFNKTVRTSLDIFSAKTDYSINSVTVASRTFFLNGRPTSVMFFDDDVQPTFFLHDHGTAVNQMCGMWGHGSSDQSWQGTHGSGNALNHDDCHVSSPYSDRDGNIHCAVAYLAESFSKNFVTYTRTGVNPIQAVNTTKFVSTVGLADVEFSKPGRATEYADELLIPGPQSTCFTGAVFTEDNFNLFPSPFTIAQSHSDAGLLDENKDYSIVVVFEYTDTRGNRVKSRPSDPQLVTLTGTNNIMTITGPTLFETYGKSNVMICIYSTYITSGSISTDHRKVTDDLDPLLNDKGSLTWSFNFNKSSEDIQAGEILYTDNGLLPHDPCPAHTVGCIAGNRALVYGYDGAIWYSNEKSEGDNLTFNTDALRVFMPTSDEIESMEALDSMRVILFGSRSIWEFDISQLPGPDGLNGNVQSPKKLPFNNGCNGISHLLKDGAAYTSSAGGVWMVTRGLENIQLSAPEVTDFSGQTVAGIATDDKQRTMFGLKNRQQSIVRDGLSYSWGDYAHPRIIKLVHRINGMFCYADDISVHVNDGTAYDTYLDDSTQDEVVSSIVQDIQTTPINFGTVKGLKCVWRFLVYGVLSSQHDLIVDATYETEDGTYTESWTVKWEQMLPQYPRLEISFEPKVIEMSSISLRFRPDYSRLGVATPGASFELETVSFEAGIDSYLNRTPAAFRGRST